MTFITDIIEQAFLHPAICCILLAIVVFGWNTLTSYVSSGFSWVGGLAGGTTKTVTQAVTTAEDAADAIHTLTIWAVDNGTPELMSKITSLWSDLKATKAAATPIVTTTVTTIAPAPAPVVAPVIAPVVTPAAPATS